MIAYLLPVAVSLLMLASPLQAESEFEKQDWIPEVLEMPADTEIVTDREIGSSIRVFLISTEEDANDLLDRWREALEEEGFQVMAPMTELESQQLQFSGSGIENATISIAPGTAEGRNALSFDATLSP